MAHNRQCLLLSSHGLRAERPHSAPTFTQLSAFGVKIMPRNAFFARPDIPSQTKRAMRAKPGAYVLYCRRQNGRALLLAHDDTATLCALALDVLGRA